MNDSTMINTEELEVIDVMHNDNGTTTTTYELGGKVPYHVTRATKDDNFVVLFREGLIVKAMSYNDDNVELIKEVLAILNPNAVFIAVVMGKC